MGWKLKLSLEPDISLTDCQLKMRCFIVSGSTLNVASCTLWIHCVQFLENRHQKLLENLNTTALLAQLCVLQTTNGVVHVKTV